MFFLKTLPTQAMLDKYAKQFANMDTQKTADTLTKLRQASLLIRKLEQFFSDEGLSLTRFLILILLDREQTDETVRPMTLTDLVERMDVSKTVITNTVKTLEKSALVSIQADNSDARAKNIKITKLGQKRLHELLPDYYDLINGADI